MLRRAFLGLAGVLALSMTAAADVPMPNRLVDALRAGGYVIYFRHAATQWSQQDRLEKAGDWKSCDGNRMRQLADAGRAMARQLGDAIKGLDIPVSQVLSSEYCRARETAEALDLGPVRTTQEVMNLRAASYFGGREAVADRLRGRLSEPPARGTNTVIVGHGNVIRAATGVYPGEAGAAVFRPTPGGLPELVGELAPGDWRALDDDRPRPDG